MHLEKPRLLRAVGPPAAFTLMEILVVVSIILILAAIALPVYSSVVRRSNKIVAMNNMRQITATLVTYASQNDGDFPDESILAGNTWAAANTAQGEKVWYNVLPRLLGRKGVGDYANSHAAFYTKDNLLFLPGAQYPVGPNPNKLSRPFFAFAMNTKLQRKDKTTKLKGKAKMSQITNPARTIAFLEEGIPGEPKAMAIQPAYEGEPKSAGRSFVERYGGRGVVTFIDGHAEDLEAKSLLTITGKLNFPQTNVIWTRTPEEDPN